MTELLQFLPDAALSLHDHLGFLLRILVSGVLGLMIGMERTKRQKEAGGRTHCIIAMTAAVFMLLSKYAFQDVPAVADPSRIASQAVCGISFLGVGIIFKGKSNEIHGLTTAAGMWATSAVGMSVGAGLYSVGIILTAVTISTQLFLRRSSPALLQTLTIQTSVQLPAPDVLHPILESHGGSIAENSIQRDQHTWTICLTLRLKKMIQLEELQSILREHPDILKIILQ